MTTTKSGTSTESGSAGQAAEKITGTAQNSKLVLVESGAIFQGLEEFVVTRTAINLEKPGALTQERVALIEKVLEPSKLYGRTLLDVSARPAFFSFFALQNGAASATAIGTEITFAENVNRAAAHLKFDHLKAAQGAIAKCQETKDIVLALDSVVWQEAGLEKLASLTDYMIVLESPYGLDSGADNRFGQELQAHFKRVKPIGVADGRALYLAYKTEHDVDLRCPLPTFSEGTQLISCRQLTEFAGVEYWSRVYKGDDAIYKQATRELIERERAMLGKLNSKYFPRVKEVKECGDSSVLVLEHIAGSGLGDGFAEVVSSSHNFVNFAFDCLQILQQLQRAGIMHRDIQAGNILLRNGAPVLIDFGWAVTESMPMFVPAGLIAAAPDGQPCDVYSMGKLLSLLGAEKFPELLPIFELMTEADPVARVTDANDLLTVFQLATRGKAAIADSRLLVKLLANLKISRTRLSQAHCNFAALEEKTKLEQDHRLAVLEMEYEKVVTEVNKVISELKRVIGEKDELLVLLDERQKLIEGITQSQAWRLANQLQKSKKSFGSMFGKSP